MEKTLSNKIADWVEQGLLTKDQESAIRNYEGLNSATADKPSSKDNRYGEVLAYVGGLIILSGMYTLLDDLWESMSIMLQMCILIVLTTGFFGIGHRLLIPAQSEVMQRLGAFLSTVAVLSVLGTVVYGLEVALELRSELAWAIAFFIVMLASVYVARRLRHSLDTFTQASSVLLQYTTALSGFLWPFIVLSELMELDEVVSSIIVSTLSIMVSAFVWRIHATLIVHSITYAFVLILCWSVTANLDGDFVHFGLVTWPLALVWFGLCVWRILRPAEAGLLMSSVLLPISAILIGVEWELVGSIVLLGTGVLLIVFSTREFNMRIFTSGALCVLFASPALMFELFGGILPTSLLLILSGIILLGGGLYLNRIRQDIIQEKSESDIS